jgi:hypothetical protein
MLCAALTHRLGSWVSNVKNVARYQASSRVIKANKSYPRRTDRSPDGGTDTCALQAKRTLLHRSG